MLQYIHSNTLLFCPRSCSWFAWLPKSDHLCFPTPLCWVLGGLRSEISSKRIGQDHKYMVSNWSDHMEYGVSWLHFKNLPTWAIPTNLYRPALHPGQQIYLKWNENRSCSSCHFVHICYHCIHFPHVTDKNHKAIECPRKEKREATRQPKGPPALMNL